MADRDTIRRFLFENFPVRGELVHLNATWQAVLDRYDYPPEVREILGQLMASATMLASALKFDGTLTVQVQGDGPLHLMVVQCTSNMTLRGLARFKDELEPGTLTEMTGGGRLVITVESRGDGNRYQGVVPLDGDTLADCIQRYFENSVQLPTRLWIAADGESATGMLIQRVPGEMEDEDAWQRVQTLAETVQVDELMSLKNEEILRRLFHEEDVRLFEPAPVAFRCNCSRDRIESVLRALGADELKESITDEGDVRVRCEFCNRSHVFDPVDIAQLLATTTATPGSKLKH